MKKNILLLILVLLVGGLAIILPGLISKNKEQKEFKKNQIEQAELKKNMEDISTKVETLEEQDIDPEKRNPEAYNKEQMYFENIEEIDQYFSMEQIEYIKQNVQTHIRNYISKDILDCSLNKETLKKEDDKIKFQLNMKDVKYYEVIITTTSQGEITDITIYNNLH